MEEVYSRAGKRTWQGVARILLSSFSWPGKEHTAFENFKHALAHQVTKSQHNDSQRLCINIDASDFLWTGIVTKVPHSDLSLPHIKQRHGPLAF